MHALYKSYWAAMNKIFIYARPSVRAAMMKTFYNFWNLASFWATQTNSKTGEDVSPIIEPEWFVEKSAVKTDIFEHYKNFAVNRMQI